MSTISRCIFARNARKNYGMNKRICPFCGYIADTRTGVHDFRDDCLKAARADNAVLRAELEQMRRYLEMLNELTDELVKLER